MQNPRLTTKSEDGFPTLDAHGSRKFSPPSVRCDGVTDETPNEDIWWRATEFYPNGDRAFEISELRFSSKYLAWIDSDSALRFPVYTPLLYPSASSGCPPEYLDLQSACPGRVLEGDSKLEGANWDYLGSTGWRSTAIPYTGETLVYRDPSVIRLPNGMYAMFVVACWDPDNLLKDGYEKDNDVCTLCIPECTNVVHTRMVYFLSASGDFQGDLLGPYQALPPRYQPNPAEPGGFLGVPDVFLDPSGDFIFLHMPGNATISGRPYGSSTRHGGMYVCSMADFIGSATSIDTWSPWSGEAFPKLADARKPNALRVFRRLGALTIEGQLTSRDPVSPIDESFGWCNGRLVLFFANVIGEDDERATQGVGQYLASTGLDEPVRGRTTVANALEVWLRTGAEGTFRYAHELLTFRRPCAPLYRRTASSLSPAIAKQVVVRLTHGDFANDPEILMVGDGGVMHVRSRVLGSGPGLVTLSKLQSTLC